MEQVSVGGRVGAVSYAIGEMDPAAAYAVKLDGGKATAITEANGMVAAGTEKPTAVRVEIVRTLGGKTETLVDETVTTEDARTLVASAREIAQQEADLAAIVTDAGTRETVTDVERQRAIKTRVAVLMAENAGLSERLAVNNRELAVLEGLTAVIGAAER